MFKLSDILNKIKSFFKEVYLELRKVNWLSRKELLKYTLIVILISVAVAIFLGGLDYIFTTIIKRSIIYR